MSRRTRRTFTPEFKAKVVLDVLTGTASQAEACHKHQISPTGNTSSGSAIITSIPSTTGMVAGMPISGTGIPASTTVLSVDSGTQIHISANATSTNTGGAILVAPYGVGDGSTTFNVPDLRGRVVAGRDDMGGSTAMPSTPYRLLLPTLTT